MIDDEITAVKDLNISSGFNWKIKVKVHKKYEITKIKNGLDYLKLELVDKYSTFINAAVFSDDSISLNN